MAWYRDIVQYKHRFDVLKQENVRKLSLSLPVSAMNEKQGKKFTTAKIFKKVRKMLFVTVTILSPNVLRNNCCIKIMVDTYKIMENVHMTKVIFLHHFCD